MFTRRKGKCPGSTLQREGKKKKNKIKGEKDTLPIDHVPRSRGTVAGVRVEYRSEGNSCLGR